MNRRVATLTLTLLLAAACAPAPAPAGSPSASPPPSPSTPDPSGSVAPAPSPTPGGTPAAGLYLRAWLSQALAPEHTVTWLPTLTVSDGMAIDGNVAIPMIYPGPLMVMPNVRALSAEGEASIVEMAGQLGLLDGPADFTGDELMPGGQTAHVVLRIDGQERELVGNPNSTGRCAPGDLNCQPEAGTPEAFAFFWARLGYLDDWLAAELGAPIDYTPERLVVITTPPVELEVPVQPVGWPLEQPLAEFGQPWAIAGSRCATVSGEDLQTLLPVLLAGNQATVFVDGQDDARALLARVLVPGEPSPCD